MIGDPEQIETIAEPISRILSDTHERFPPGALLASRYRIISRLGKGGMGEVFRADDLILGQSVALKFLPESARNNVNLLTRFYDEVRIARQISHKNVCRVYDIGEVDGQPYLSMEYIDGEDLGSLLRRIGRLPADKATEFARKLCAGVAAAHSQGVLHRDLKPANIMIDVARRTARDRFRTGRNRRAVTGRRDSQRHPRLHGARATQRYRKSRRKATSTRWA